MTSPILFLDFDGLLHPGSKVDSGFLCRAPDLEEALAGLDLGIEVSSNGRFYEIRAWVQTPVLSRWLHASV